MSRVVITGGASGIGARMAERFSEAGDQVAICDASADAVSEFATHNPGIRAVQADVRDEAQMDAFLGSLKADWGGVDVVCANAGTGGPAGRIEDLSY
ncbi:MAG: SDR family NAD(P)-dependent oxidoreductase, partial [Boseongicola sp.]